MGGPAASSPGRTGTAAANRGAVVPDRWWEDRAAVGGAMALAVGLGWGLGRSFWFDEVVTASRATLPTDRLLELFSGGDAANATYYLLIGGLRLGDGEVALRLPSALAAVATLIVTVRLAGRIIGPRAAAVSAALLAVNGLVHQHGQEARSYAIAMLLAAGAAWCAYDGTVGGDRRRWFQVAALGGAGIAFHLTVALAVAGVVAGVLAAGLVVRGRVRRHARPAVAALGGAGLVLVVFTDYITRRRRRGLPWIPDLDLGEFVGTVTRLVAGAPRPALLVGMGVAVLPGVVTGVRRHASSLGERTGVFLLAGWAAVPVVVTLAVAIAVQPAFVARYMAVAAPAITVLVAAAVAAAPARLQWPAALLAVAVATAGLLDWRLGARYDERQDWRGLVSALADEVEPGDVVVVTPTFSLRAFRWYSGGGAFQGVRVAGVDQGRFLPADGAAVGGEVFVVRAFGRPPVDVDPDDEAGLVRTEVRRFDGRLILERWASG